jgi:alginate O-acetyltransferase complex protein AlgI
VARRRHCASGACELKPSANKSNYRLVDFLPLLVLLPLAFILGPMLTPWIFMWAMVFAIFAGFKWLTYREARRQRHQGNRIKIAGYLFAWPGMDAADFLGTTTALKFPTRIEWLLAALKTLFGAALLWSAARTMLPEHPLLAGWIGMVGVIFMLHFGLFHLLSLAWRRVGVNAVPIMQNPLRSKSLVEFWGKRWNNAFNVLAFRFWYRPLRSATTPALATLIVFGLSGLIHELVISLPAKGGYGLPTAYFFMQGLGMVLERSAFGRGLGLGRGLRGKIYVIALTAGPAFWLFHPPFVRNVILPMLHAIGAT